MIVVPLVVRLAWNAKGACMPVPTFSCTDRITYAVPDGAVRVRDRGGDRPYPPR